MRLAEAGIDELQRYVDTLIVIPNQNLFRVANERTTFAEAFAMADQVLHSGVRSITDLMVLPGLINLDFADVRTVMSRDGQGDDGHRRRRPASDRALRPPRTPSRIRCSTRCRMKGAKAVLVNITGGLDMTLLEVDEAANRISEQVDPEANIIFGAAFDDRWTARSASRWSPPASAWHLIPVQQRIQVPRPAPVMPERGRLSERLAGLSAMPPQPMVDLDERASCWRRARS